MMRMRYAIRGLTLVEIMVSISIASLLFLIGMAIMLAGGDAWHTNSARIELQQELRKATDWMLLDLREAGRATITNVPDDGGAYPTITFRTATGVSAGATAWSANTVQFVLNNAGQLLRVSGAQSKVLANNIVFLGFTRQPTASSIVEVALGAQKDTATGRTIAVNTHFKVQLRN